MGDEYEFADPDDGRRRFLLELEFVQLFANPTYIHYLAQNRYFDDPAFVAYLSYLQYWRRPEYAKFIMYPHALFFLDLLQSTNFRAAMAHPGPKEVAHRQQFYFWRHYRNNRLKLLQEQGRPPAMQEDAGQVAAGAEEAALPLALRSGNGALDAKPAKGESGKGPTETGGKASGRGESRKRKQIT